MEHRNAIALTLLRPKFSPSQLFQLYEKAGSATAIVENYHNIKDILPDLSDNYIETFSKMEDALLRADKEIDFCERHEIQVLSLADDNYPQRLRECPDPPFVIYYRGNADLNCKRIVNIIGTRKCTIYGQDLIRRFVADLKKACPDTLIVSGLAYGVDVNAHRSALDNGMLTVGVLAHGLNMIYPSSHREIAKKMLLHGGLLTEYPSQTRIDKRNFLERNRIVAGLSDACIIPESAIHGGGLVTCRISNDYNRSVFAFPGPVTAEYSKGCNNLIRHHGAQMITCAQDFLDEMGWKSDAELEAARERGIERCLFPDLGEEEIQMVVQLQKYGDLSTEKLSEYSKLPMQTVTAALFTLEMVGVVRPMAGGMYHLLA